MDDHTDFGTLTQVYRFRKPPIKIPQPKVDLEQIYSRFTQSKKEVTVNDLQKQIKATQSEFRSLKQELTILRVDLYIYIYHILYIIAEAERK